MAQKILIIDDDPLSLEMTALILRQDNHTVFEAQTGSQGLSLAFKEMPSLIVLDFKLPDMDGSEVCKQIRTNPDIPQPQILMATGETQALDRILALLAGANDYIAKPMTVDDLTAKVKGLLQRQRWIEVNLDTNDPSTWDVLAVDDEVFNLDIYQHIVAFNNIKLRIADNGLKALELIRQRQPSLILLDLKMPRMSGWDVIKQIREEPKTAHLPVIAVTAHAMIGDAEQIMAAGFNGYIVKPISPLGFINSLRAMLATFK